MESSRAQYDHRSAVYNIMVPVDEFTHICKYRRLKSDGTYEKNACNKKIKTAMRLANDRIKRNGTSSMMRHLLDKHHLSKSDIENYDLKASLSAEELKNLGDSEEFQRWTIQEGKLMT